MALKIQYTETFEYTFKVLVEFIRENWGEAVVEDFVKETEKIIDLIASFPNMYKPSSFDKNVRVAQVRKLSSLLATNNLPCYISWTAVKNHFGSNL
ncbi:hypothetical protein H8B06_11875 [Sphingobacterium sp. DN00404]|uniref:Type II toxin-antitoxin system RelE/ParE family toxin n=1 Tax=Sphingobacterium micropteri TaxID=2763501 RepID=A0ABR7YQD5_9SPHI|nr:hypothetical protein [Sphingobacterium micropteri]MBD1433530.1 hypothetical protein [Sphingobacterium micropteri]